MRRQGWSDPLGCGTQRQRRRMKDSRNNDDVTSIQGDSENMEALPVLTVASSADREAHGTSAAGC